MTLTGRIDETDATADDSEASTVSMGDDKSNASSYFEAINLDTNQESFLLSEIEENDLIESQVPNDDHISTEGKQNEGKVNVLDIFNKFQPSKIRKDQEETSFAYDKPQALCDDQFTEIKLVKKSGITAKDILTGKRASNNKKKEEVKNTIGIQSGSEGAPIGEKEVVKFGVTARDILTGKPKHAVSENVEMIEVLSSEDEVTSKTSKKSKKRRNKKSKNREETMIVKLNYKPRRDRIADLENKIRNSIASSVSAKDLFKRFDRKLETPEMLVKLKLKPDILKQFKKNESSFFTKGSSQIVGAKSYLDMLSYKPVAAKNPIHKLKELPTPIPTKEQLHVTYESEPIQHRHITLKRKQNITSSTKLDYSIIEKRSQKLVKSNKDNHILTLVQDYDLVSIAKERVSKLEVDPRCSRFVHMLKSPQNVRNPTNNLWSDFFRPKISEEILFDSRKTQSMKQWLQNSFQILKKKTKRPNFRRLRKNDIDEFDNFIVDEYDEDTEEEEYVPIMILSGPEGIGKTSSVYTMVEEVSGYVYEINASQARGRKDILANLKELSTTQLVHQNQDLNDPEFQKGVILFEDVDILFESDRGFWSVMEHVLTISRRPIILTCTDASVIPSHILECAMNSGTLYGLERQPLKVLSDYLFLMALTRKVQLDEDTLKQLIIENSNDLRKCVSALQVFCEIENPHGDLVELSSQKQILPPSITEESEVEKLAQIIDAYSVSDLWGSNVKSLVNQDFVEDEVLKNDTFINEEDTRTALLPYELRIDSEIQEMLPSYPYDGTKMEVKSIKRLDKEFHRSKLKPQQRLTRYSAMSMFDFDENNDAKNIFTIPGSTYTTDVSPFFRAFSRAEVQSDLFNAKTIRETGKPIDELLREGLLRRKRFSAPSDMLLYGSLRYWNVYN